MASEEVKEAKTHPIGSNARIVSPYKFSAGAQSAGFMGSAEAAIKAPSKEAAGREEEEAAINQEKAGQTIKPPKKWEPPLVSNTQNRSNQKIFFFSHFFRRWPFIDCGKIRFEYPAKLVLNLRKDLAAYLA